MESSFLRKQKYFFLFLIPAVLAAVVMLAGESEPIYWFRYWWLFPFALAVSILANVAGISSAAIMVPFFLLIFPLVAETLSGLESVRVGIINEAFGLTSSTFSFIAFGLVDRKIALNGLFLAVPFTLAGVFIATVTPTSVIYLVVASLLLTSVLLSWYAHHLRRERREQLAMEHHVDTRHSTHEERVIRSADGKRYTYCPTEPGYKRRWAGFVVGGFFQGAAGFGVGEIGTISMVLTKIPVRIAVGTIHVLIAGTAVVATLIHGAALIGASEAFHWNIIAMTIPGAILGGQLAPFVAARISAHLLERVISVLFIAIAFALLVLAMGDIA